MLYIEIVSPEEIMERMDKANRNYFSYEGYERLIDYYEDEDVELDPVGLCCEWRECDIDEILDDYGYMLADYLDECDEVNLEGVTDALNDYTYAVQLSNDHILYQVF